MPLAPFLLALAVAAPPAGDAPPPDVRDEVRALLGSIHGPVSPESFRALGPGAEEALLAFARDDSTMPSARVRALEALAGLGGARAEAAHRDVARSASATSAVRRSAVRGLGRLAGRARAPGELTPFLEADPDPAVRAVAAEALAAAAPAESCPKIRARARAERSPGRFRRALVACGAAGPASAE
jgi:HEAT repeat protein